MIHGSLPGGEQAEGKVMKEQTRAGSLTDPHPSSRSTSLREAPCLVYSRHPGHWGVVDTGVTCEAFPQT